VAHHVLVQIDAAFQPVKVVAMEMELEAKSTFRLSSRYEVDVKADQVVVTTTRFARRWKATHA